MKILQGLFQNTQQPPVPTHVGEVFHIWSILVELNETRALIQLMANHTNDTDLKELAEHFIDDVLTPQQKRVAELMRNEGINAPPLTTDVSKAEERLIPPGAKLTDFQVAQMLVVKVIGLLEWSHRGTVHSVRDDVSMMFNSFYNHVLAQGYTLKKLMNKRGWLLIPPSYSGGVVQVEGGHH